MIGWTRPIETIQALGRPFTAASLLGFTPSGFVYASACLLGLVSVEVQGRSLTVVMPAWPTTAAGPCRTRWIDSGMHLGRPSQTELKEEHECLVPETRTRRAPITNPRITSRDEMST